MSQQVNTLANQFSATQASPVPSVRRLFLEGGVALGIAVAIQRLFAFVSTALAARIGGAAVLGEYSLALSTAGMVGAFVGTGVGTVALRYAAQFPRNTQAFRKVLRIIAVITLVTAACAGLVMFLGSKPLAQFALDNPKLDTSLKFAATAIVVLVLYEALNGVLVALQAFRSLLWLAVVSGVLTLIAVPYASQFGATFMVLCYSVALLAGLVAAFVTARAAIRPLKSNGSEEPTPPRAREIILFGNTQQVNTVVVSVASWWIILLISRQDPTLHHMGYYFVGSQLRILAAQAPTLASQLVFPTLSRYGTLPEDHDRVLSTATFLCAALSFLPAGALLVGLPWVLQLYGMANRTSLIVCLILIATAVVQLTYVPASNALMMLSLRSSVLLNVVWSLALVVLGYVLITKYGAIGGSLAWLLSQLLSQGLLVYLMKRLGRLPERMLTTLFLADLAVLSLAGLAYYRTVNAETSITLTAISFVTFIAWLFAFLKISQARDYLPKGTRELLTVFKSAPSVVFSSLSPRRVET